MFAQWDNGKLVLDFNQLPKCDEITIRVAGSGTLMTPNIYIEMKTSPYDLSRGESWGAKIEERLKG